MANQLGIMSGRLSVSINNRIQEFPIDSWREEFEKAHNIGYDVIEWVFDLNKNPIMYDDGVKEIKSHCVSSGIKINSVCADYFMINLLFNASDSQLSQNTSVLKTLIRQCHKCEISILELPFVDSSSLKTESDQTQILQNLELVLPYAQENNVVIALETDLSPHSFSNLLEKFNHPNLMANYDVGNSTANCFDISDELKVLKDWIVNMHVKDRIKKGGTVPLGTGDTDFDLFFQTLKKIAYCKDLIIQGAREDLHDKTLSPETTCGKYLKFVKQYVDKYL